VLSASAVLTSESRLRASSGRSPTLPALRSPARSAELFIARLLLFVDGIQNAAVLVAVDVTNSGWPWPAASPCAALACWTLPPCDSNAVFARYGEHLPVWSVSRGFLTLSLGAIQTENRNEVGCLSGFHVAYGINDCPHRLK